MRTLCTAAALAVLFTAAPEASGGPERPEASEGPERLVLAPEEGTRVSKAFTMRHSLVVVEDEKLDEDGEIPLSQIELESGFRVDLSDTFHDQEGERPIVFRRRFENALLEAHVTAQTPSGPQSDSLMGTSPLADKSVVFTWIEEDGEYGRYYDVLQAGEEHLPLLAEDTNLVCLLPGRAVSVGDEWEISPAAMRDVFGYGGDVPLFFARPGDILLARGLLFGVGGSLWHAFAAPPKGTVTARFEEVRTIAGERIAAVKIAFDLSFDVDQTELARAKRNGIELTSRIEVVRARLQLHLKGDGELLWNLDRNVPHQLGLVAEEEVEQLREIRRSELPLLHAAPPSQRMKLIGALRVDLKTTIP